MAHGSGRHWIACDLVGDDDARLGVDQIDQPQRQLGEVLLFLFGVRLFLHIEIGHRAQQRRPDVDADRAIWVGKVGRFGHGCTDVTTRKMRICRRLVRLPLANR